LAGSKKQKRSGVKVTVTKLGSSPDFADWNITDIELYRSGLRKRMIGALNEVVRFSLKDGADVRFAGFADGKKKDPLTMIVSFPGMAPGDGCIPVPTANQTRAYWWCSPLRIGRQRMRPTVSAAREIGASLCNDKWVRVPL
jgi:hypothetical protein